MRQKFWTYIILLGVCLVNTNLFAANDASQTFTLDGQLFHVGTTSPLIDSGAQLKVQILDPSQTCVLYEETQNVNTTATEGFFTIQVGSLPGAGKRTGLDPAQSMSSVIQNISPIPASSAPGQTCTSYSPVAGDTRYFRITVIPSSGSPDTLTPDMVLDSVPSAIVAQSVEGLDRGSILHTNTTTPAGEALTQTNLESLFTATAFANLTTVASGQYVQSGTGGANLPSFAVNPAAPSAGDIWYNSATQNLVYSDGSTSHILGTAGAGLSSLTVTARLTANGVAAGTLNAPGTIDLNTVGTAGNYVKVTTDAYGRVTGNGLLAETDIPTLSTAGKVSATAINNGTMAGNSAINTSGNLQTTGDITTQRFFIYDHAGVGPNYVGMTAPADLTAAGGASYIMVWPDRKGSANQVLTTDGSGNLSWATPVSGAYVLKAGDTMTGPLNNNSNSVNTALAVAQAGAGYAATFTGGSVGIGTASPGAQLHLLSTASTLTQESTAGGSNHLQKSYGGSSGYTQQSVGNNAYFTQQVADAGWAPVTNGDGVGVWGGEGFDGATFIRATQIASFVGGPVSSGVVPGILAFYTRDSSSLNEVMRLNSAGRVGIGNTNPGSKLTVAGTIESTTGGIRFPDGTVQTTATGGGSGGTMFPNFPDAIVCNMTSPAAGPSVYKATHISGASALYRLNSGGTDFNLTFDASGAPQATSGWSASNCGSASIAQLYSAGQAFNYVGGGSNLWTASGSNTFFGGGNVGINTTTPNAREEIVGSNGAPASSGSAMTGALRLRGGDNGVLDFGLISGSKAWLQSTDQTSLGTNYPLLLNPNGGNVGINTTNATSALTVAGGVSVSGGVSSSSMSTDVLSAGASGNIFIDAGYGNVILSDYGNSISIGNQYNMFITHNPALNFWGKNSATGNYSVAAINNDSDGHFAISRSSATDVTATRIEMPLLVDGDITPYADNSSALGSATNRFTAVYAVNGTVQTSDARMKTNIQDSDLGLDFINKLRPVSYNWKASVDRDLHYGLIAQEADRAVRESARAPAAIVDFDKKSDRFGLRYTELISPLIKSVQEMFARLLGIEARQREQDQQIKNMLVRMQKLEEDNAQKQKRIEELEKR